MKPLKTFKPKNLSVIFTDIDDTLTDQGQLLDSSYSSLWALHKSGIKIVPVTGRPAGWCELIARQWPVEGVIGENGGFYFTYKGNEMKRHFALNENVRKTNKRKIENIRREILDQVPGSAIASDQFCRLMDLAVDYCEDVAPLKEDLVNKIIHIFEKHGAQAKVSSIHVNGWFGNYDKLSMCRIFVEQALGMDIHQENSTMAFCGDSPNDEPMFQFFENSIAVANIKKFEAEIIHFPKYVANKEGAEGFSEIAAQILSHVSK